MFLTRFRQGIYALFAWARPVDDAPAVATLPPNLLTLFYQMSRREQQHALEVLATLRANGATHPALLQAGLLHDLGKLRAPFYVWERVMVVLTEAAVPELAHAWGAGEPRGWRRPFVIRRQHAAWSAELVAAAGGDPLTVELIRRHQDKLIGAPHTEADHLLLALQAADDAN
ncbi:MAG: HD domain-containing protein [Anaerolineae bacterium]|nr:HD domain-containing protein [Anaerolineae bacterium]